MKAGALDRRITIEAKVVAIDPDYGTETVTWATLFSRIPAQVQDSLPSKSESATDGIIIGVRPARIRIRFMTGIKADMRLIVHGDTDRLMQITAGPAEIGRREGIELMAVEYSTQGGA